MFKFKKRLDDVSMFPICSVYT